jgi:hypothetical protein
MVCAALCGCATTWDDLTSRDFHVRTMFSRPDPMTVLRESSDGDARAKAMRALKEPSQTGGSDAEQDEALRILTTAATNDSQPLCRLEAIRALGRFQDPRVVPVLISSYESAAQLPVEVSAAIQSQALTALGETRQPAAVKFLVQESGKRMPSEAGDRERQQVRDTRLAAVRALGNFERSPEVAEAMARLVQSEKDVALRDRARDTYVKVAGSEPPAGAAPSPLLAPKPDTGVQLTGGTKGQQE